jgi:hypothetical protein
MRIANTNTVGRGLKFAEYMTINTPMHWIYKMLWVNVQLLTESVLNWEVMSDRRNIAKTCNCLQNHIEK